MASIAQLALAGIELTAVDQVEDLEQAVRRALDAYAEKNDVTRSEAVRRLVEMGLAKGKAR